MASDPGGDGAEAAGEDDSVWASTVVLNSGDTAYLRPLTPDDRDALRDFHERQSPHSTYTRFFSPKPTLSDAELDHFTGVDMVDRAAVAIEIRDEFVAWASYEKWPGRPEAEAAFMVDDAHQGQGMATLMLEHLAAIARANGIERFTAEVLAENRAMLTVFAKAGWPLQRRFDSGVVDLDWELAPTHDFIDSVERREQRADSRAVARLLVPKAIAVIGASDREGSVGSVIWQHVAQSSSVPLHAVNPRIAAEAGVLDGHPCVAAVADLPDDVSLAIIVVGVDLLESTIDACIDKRMRGAIIITNIEAADPVSAADGPRPDAGADVVDVEALVSRSRRNGLRLIGPSSMGIAALGVSDGLQASIAHVDLPAGHVAVSMQGGSLGISMLQRARQMQLGMSWFVSLGAKSDISGNDLLQFWEDDTNTRVIGMYLESFGNPRKFARLARRVSLAKPIVAVRAGAAVGPTAGALFLQAGLIEVPTVQSLLDTVRVLADQPVLSGEHVAVISNSHSPTTLAADALRTAGLSPVTSHADLQLELGWDATAEQFGDAVDAAMRHRDVDGVVVINAPAVIAEPDAAAQAIDRAAWGRTKPIVAIMLGRADGPIVPGSNVPSFSFPEQAADVLGRSYGYWVWREREADAPPPEIREVDPTRAAEIIAEQLERLGGDGETAPGGEVDSEGRQRLLASYGIAMARERFVRASAAADAAADVGFPVAVKAEHRGVGRSVKAGVALDVDNADEVDDVIAQMHESLGAGATNVTVQRMVSPGVDARIRCEHDARSGVVVSVGLGGANADAVDDRTSRLAPVSPASAIAMLGETRVGLALDAANLDTSMLVDTIVQVAQLASDHPDIDEIDINPIIVSTDGAVVTDAVVTLVPHDHPNPALRRVD